MSAHLPPIGKERPLLPPPDCPAIYGEGVDDLRTARFEVDDGLLIPGQPEPDERVEILGYFAHTLGAIEGAVRVEPISADHDDPIVELAGRAREDPALREEIRKGLCPLVLSCTGIYRDDKGLHCGAFTAAAFRRVLGSKLDTDE